MRQACFLRIEFPRNSRFGRKASGRKHTAFDPLHKSLWVWYNTYTMSADFDVKEYKFISDKVIRPMTFAFLADLHSAEHGPGNEDLICAVRAAGPDAILIPGDILVGNKTVKVKETVELMKRMREIAPVYFSNGNHCTNLRLFLPKYYRKLMKGFRSAGVTVLNNRSAEAVIAGNRVRVYGLELHKERYRKLRIPRMPEEEVEESLGGCDRDAFSILLAHNPQFAKRYFEWGADLVVAGHFHGGVMRLFGNRVLISPYGIPLPRYGYGAYEHGSQHMVVTSGLGEHTIPFRIHNPMEIVVIRVEGTAPRHAL